MAEMDKTLYALQLLGRSTTDNAAADTQHTASPVSDSPTQPAAPTQTPWTDKAWNSESSIGLRDHSRLLEVLVHRQHEAFRKIDALLFDTDGTGFVALEADQREQAMWLCDELQDAYVALEKEIGRG